MKNTIFIIALLFSTFSYSQNNGFLGKKNVVTVNVGGFPSWFGVNNDFFIYKKNRWHTKWALEYQRTLSRKLSITAYYSRYRNDFPSVDYTQDYDDYLVWKGDENHYASFNEFGVSLRLYKRHDAPLGRYRALKLSIVNNSFEIDESNYYEESKSTPISKDIYKDGGSAFKMSFVFGSTRIINQQFYVDYSAEIGLFLDPFGANTIIGDSYEYIHSDDLFYSQLKRLAQQAGATHGFFLINVGVGYLF